MSHFDNHFHVMTDYYDTIVCFYFYITYQIDVITLDYVGNSSNILVTGSLIISLDFAIDCCYSIEFFITIGHYFLHSKNQQSHSCPTTKRNYFYHIQSIWMASFVFIPPPRFLLGLENPFPIFAFTLLNLTINNNIFLRFRSSKY